MDTPLVIGDCTVSSRLFVGTGKIPLEKMKEVILAAGAQVVTVALRRVDLHEPGENILDCVPADCILLPNTSGARNAEEAIRLAYLARAGGCGNWVKIEVVSDHKYLLPDNYETLKATEQLVKDGFTVLPYMSPDLMVAKALEAAGAAAVMPLGAPIGTNRGLKTRELIGIMIEECRVPVIVDAGIGSPSHAAEAMEMGASAVLLNTAIASARDPVAMARAFRLAVESGRTAYLAGPGQETSYACASSPLTGFLD
jgi:thiazole synthase